MIGVGKHRFFNIRSAATQGLERFPTDQRFLPREGRPQSVKRQAVYDFLHGLYEQSAETLPDQHTSHSNKRPRQGPYKYDDPTLSRSEVRHLPPGKFMDYLRLCRLENPDFTISRQLFSSARAPKSLDWNNCQNWYRKCFLFFRLLQQKLKHSNTFIEYNWKHDPRCGWWISRTSWGSGILATTPSAACASGIAWSSGD